jgi:hypothetical protein
MRVMGVENERYTGSDPGSAAGLSCGRSQRALIEEYMEQDPD